MELDVSAKRQRADPPARAARINPRPQFRTEAKRECVDFDAAPSTDQIVPQLMDGDDKAQNQDEGNDVPSEPSREVGDRIHYRHAWPPAPPEAAPAAGRWLLNR